MAGMFTIESHPALVLFDSGASHSFMSMGFVERHNLSLLAIPYAYKIRTAGSQMFINTRTDTVSLVLATHTYRLLPLSLIVCRFQFSCHKFNSICRKYVQHLYLQINILKTRFKYLSNDTNYVP